MILFDMIRFKYSLSSLYLITSKKQKGGVKKLKKKQEEERLLEERPEGMTNTFPSVEHLAEAEIMTVDILHVVFLKSPLDHLRRVVLTGQLEMKQNRSHSFKLLTNVTMTFI